MIMFEDHSADGSANGRCRTAPPRPYQQHTPDSGLIPRDLPGHADRHATGPGRDVGVARRRLQGRESEPDGWSGPTGRPCLSSARKLLPAPAGNLGVALPGAEALALAPHGRPPSDFPDNPVSCPLRELGPLSLEPVTQPAARRRREAMIETCHPQGRRRPPGGQLRYRIRSAQHGIPGGIGFAAAGIQLGPRDAMIGWSADARMNDIGQVACNNRFLVLPSVRVHGLASRVLRLACARIADDWSEACGVRPVPVQSFTGPQQSGLSYRAAGWKCCPQPTSGRRSGVRRAVRLRPLVEGWRDALCQEKQRSPGWSGSMYCTGGRAHPAADRRDGRCPDTASRQASAGDLPRKGRADGSLAAPVR